MALPIAVATASAASSCQRTAAHIELTKLRSCQQGGAVSEHAGLNSKMFSFRCEC